MSMAQRLPSAPGNILEGRTPTMLLADMPQCQPVVPLQWYRTACHDLDTAQVASQAWPRLQAEVERL